MEKRGGRIAILRKINLRLADLLPDGGVGHVCQQLGHYVLVGGYAQAAAAVASHLLLRAARQAAQLPRCRGRQAEPCVFGAVCKVLACAQGGGYVTCTFTAGVPPWHAGATGSTLDVLHAQ